MACVNQLLVSKNGLACRDGCSRLRICATGDWARQNNKLAFCLGGVLGIARMLGVNKWDDGEVSRGGCTLPI